MGFPFFFVFNFFLIYPFKCNRIGRHVNPKIFKILSDAEVFAQSNRKILRHKKRWERDSLSIKDMRNSKYNGRPVSRDNHLHERNDITYNNPPKLLNTARREVMSNITDDCGEIFTLCFCLKINL